MSFQNISTLHVFYNGNFEKKLVGQLVLKDRKIFFEYDATFLKTGLELSPFKLPLKSGVIPYADHLFEGLFGVFNDSLPDGWGHLLLDRKLMTLGIPAGALSPLDRLCYVGGHGMGALTYEPEINGLISTHYDNLDVIADKTLQFQEKDDERFVEDLLFMNGSSAGVRPKIMVNFEEGKLTLGGFSSQEGKNNNWIVKFRSSLDPKDMGAIEYAYTDRD